MYLVINKGSPPMTWNRFIVVLSTACKKLFHDCGSEVQLTLTGPEYLLLFFNTLAIMLLLLLSHILQARLH